MGLSQTLGLLFLKTGEGSAKGIRKNWDRMIESATYRDKLTGQLVPVLETQVGPKG